MSSWKKLLEISLLAIVIGISVSLIYFEHSFFTHEYSEDTGPFLKDGGTTGGDFISFYTAGKLFANSTQNLYDFEAQREYQNAHFRNAADKLIPFFYPPHIAAIFSLISSYDFYAAFLKFALLSFLLGSASIALLSLSLKIPTIWRIAFTLWGISFVPFAIDNLAAGQIATIGIAISVGFYLAIKKNCSLLAGFILSCGYYKPPLFLFLSLSIVALREWRILKGVLLGCCGWILLSVFLVGVESFVSYCQIAISYRAGAEILPNVSVDSNQAIGLFSFFIRMFQNIENGDFFAQMSLLISVTFLLILLGLKRRENYLLTAFPLLLSLSLFVSIQFVRYDLAIFIPSILISTAFSIQKERYFIPFILFGATLWIDFERVAHGARGASIVFATTCLILTILYAYVTQLNTPYKAQGKIAS